MRIFEAKASSSGDELELVLYGVIGSNWFEEGITATQVERALKDHPRAKNIRVRLNSPGGSLAEGLAIRTTLQQHASGRNVEAHIDGIAASAASLIAMGADRVKMHEGSNLMLHEAATMTRGDKLAHERSVNALSAANEGVVDVYSTRTGIPAPEIAKMMAAETWLTAQRAVELKFADEVVRGKPPAKAVQVSASWDLKAYGYRLDSPEAQHVVNQLYAGASARPPKETEDMSYQRIAIALGLTEAADEDAILRRIDTNKTQAAREHHALAELCELTGKAEPTEALGVARAYAQDHGKLETLETQLAASSKQLEDQEREAILRADAVDPKGHKLTPATIKFWKEQPVAMLKAFMENASYVVSNIGPRQPPKSAPAPDGTSTEVATGHEGAGSPKPYAQLSYLERHALKRKDPETYRALKQSAVEAGEV